MIAINSCSQIELEHYLLNELKFPKRKVNSMANLIYSSYLPIFHKSQLPIEIPNMDIAYPSERQDTKLMLNHYASPEGETRFTNTPLGTILVQEGYDLEEIHKTNQLFIVDRRLALDYLEKSADDRSIYLLNYIRSFHPQADLIAVGKEGSYICTLPNEKGNYAIRDLIRRNNPLARLNAHNGWTTTMTECTKGMFYFKRLRVQFVDTQKTGDGSLWYVSPSFAKHMKKMYKINMFSYLVQARLVFKYDFENYQKWCIGKGTCTCRTSYYDENGIEQPIDADADMVVDASILKNITMKTPGRMTLPIWMGIRYVYDDPQLKYDNSYVIAQHFSKLAVQHMASQPLSDELTRICETGLLLEKEIHEEVTYYIDVLRNMNLWMFMQHPTIIDYYQKMRTAAYKKVFQIYGVRFPGFVVQIDSSLPDGIAVIAYRNQNIPLLKEGVYAAGRYPYINANSIMGLDVRTDWRGWSKKEQQHAKRKLCIRINAKTATIVAGDGDGDIMLILAKVSKSPQYRYEPCYWLVVERMQLVHQQIALKKSKNQDIATSANIAKLADVSTVSITQYRMNAICQHLNGMLELEELRRKVKRGDATQEESQQYLHYHLFGVVSQFNADVFKNKLIAVIEFTDDDVYIVYYVNETMIKHVYIPRKECTFVENKLRFTKELCETYHLPIDVSLLKVYDVPVSGKKEMLDIKQTPAIALETQVGNEMYGSATVELLNYKNAELFDTYSFLGIENFVEGVNNWSWCARVVSEHFEEHKDALNALPLSRFINSGLLPNERKEFNVFTYQETAIGKRVIEIVQSVAKVRQLLGVSKIDVSQPGFLRIWQRKGEKPITNPCSKSWQECVLACGGKKPFVRYEKVYDYYLNLVIEEHPNWKIVTNGCVHYLAHQFGYQKKVETALNIACEKVVAELVNDGHAEKELRKGMFYASQVYKEAFQDSSVKQEQAKWREFAEILVFEFGKVRDRMINDHIQQAIIELAKLETQIQPEQKLQYYALLWMVGNGFRYDQEDTEKYKQKAYSSWLHQYEPYDLFVKERNGSYYEKTCVKVSNCHMDLVMTQLIQIAVLNEKMVVVDQQYHIIAEIDAYDYLPRGQYHGYFVKKSAGHYLIVYNPTIIDNNVIGMGSIYTENTSLFDRAKCDIIDHYVLENIQTTRQSAVHISANDESAKETGFDVYVDCGSNGHGTHDHAIIAALTESDELLAGYMELKGTNIQQETRNRAILAGVVATIETYAEKHPELQMHTTLTPIMQCYFQRDWQKKVKLNGYRDNKGKPLKNRDLIIRLVELFERYPRVQAFCECGQDKTEDHPHQKINAMIALLEKQHDRSYFEDAGLRIDQSLYFAKVKPQILQNIR